LINYTDNYFDLELLRISDIKLHEATENIRLRNIYNRISKSKYLFNPVIVGRHDDELILLDGANRYGSLKSIGCKLILAQVIDYRSKGLRLDNWNHLVYDFTTDHLEEYCRLNKLEYTHISYAHGIQEIQSKFHYLMAADLINERNILVKLSTDLTVMVRQLDSITRLYFKRYDFDRSESDIKYTDLRKYTRRKGTLIVFPSFKKHHIVEIANSRCRLPAGISRHKVINRVLHVKYEIRKLKSENNLNGKQEELKQLLIDKIDKNKVRQYQESVIVFDE